MNKRIKVTQYSTGTHYLPYIRYIAQEDTNITLWCVVQGICGVLMFIGGYVLICAF